MRAIFGKAVVEVVSDIPGVAVGDFARGMSEGVPDGGSAAVFVDGTFDLVGGGGGTPEKALRKAAGTVGHGRQRSALRESEAEAGQ